LNLLRDSVISSFLGSLLFFYGSPSFLIFSCLLLLLFFTLNEMILFGLSSLLPLLLLSFLMLLSFFDIFICSLNLPCSPMNFHSLRLSFFDLLALVLLVFSAPLFYFSICLISCFLSILILCSLFLISTPSLGSCLNCFLLSWLFELFLLSYGCGLVGILSFLLFSFLLPSLPIPSPSLLSSFLYSLL